MADESASWKYYFDQWGPALLLFAKQQAGNQADAEDVLQEVIIKVWKKYGEQNQITKALLYTAVRTTATDFSRSYSRRRVREHRVFEESETIWFQRTIETEERNSLLEQSVQKLSNDQ